MVKVGVAPYLECSSAGEPRFSAFKARVKAYGLRTIEDLYQCSKVINGVPVTHWREGKGRAADNQDQCSSFYSHLWDTYMAENPDLMGLLVEADGLSDQFGQPGHCCQAVELWRIRNRFLSNLKNER